MSSLRETIIAAVDIVSEPIDVPEWGVKLDIRGMDGLSRARMLRECMDPETGTMDFEKLYPELIIKTAIDPTTGEHVFADDDVAILNTKAGATLEKVAKVSMRVSGLDREATERGKDASKKSPSAGSTSS